MHVLVTGATGTLGRRVVRAVHNAGHAVRLMSRQPAPPGTARGVWARANLRTGAGLGQAVAGMEAVIHCATNPKRPRPVDVTGTRQLVKALQQAGGAHLIYISIVGIEQVPLSYYKAKLEAEQIVEASGLPYTLLRATQFHELIDLLLQGLAKCPVVLPLPTRVPIQSIAAVEVAARLAQAVGDGPRGRLTDLGGPEVLPMRDVAEAWMSARGLRKPLVPVPTWGAALDAVRKGALTAPSARQGHQRWGAWLTETSASVAS
ncbi:MAG: NAD(P)H-binding protein [Bacteroidota bacterium]